jgi:hypothetical protein
MAKETRQPIRKSNAIAHANVDLRYMYLVWLLNGTPICGASPRTICPKKITFVQKEIEVHAQNMITDYVRLNSHHNS